jgi:TorA maturation chaperone TorD
MNKYCYTQIGISERTDSDKVTYYRWYTMLFQDVKLKKGCGQIAELMLKGNWNYSSSEDALKTAKTALKSLGVKYRKSI